MHTIKNLVPQSLKNFYHLCQAILANIAYGFPSKKIRVIGVTGSDGKTTTVQMITKIFQEAGKKVATASTINFIFNGKEEKNLSHYTTMSSFAVQKFIKEAVRQGCEYVILETSSHSLDQHRVWGVEYKTAVITNVTREHLDYHKTMEKYREAKKRLFEKAEKIVVNLDMERPEDYLNVRAGKKYGYTCHPELVSGSRFRIKSGMTKDDIKIIQAGDVELGIQNTKFKIQNTEFVLNLTGSFNIENALAATCVGLSEGIDAGTISRGLEEIKGIPGRMEYIQNEKGISILVDFAVTPNALEKLYSAVDAFKKEHAKIIAVFGSCGERDRGKRPIIGGIVSRYAYIVILTNEEPYHEDPQRIIEEIAAGVKNKHEGIDYFKIIDRREAIAKALKLAQKDDFVVITGMGAEESMIVGDKKIPWDDRAVAREELGKIGTK